MEPLAGLAACTVVSKNHLAYARVVCESFRRHHPDAPFVVLLADRIDGDFAPGREAFEVVELETLPIPDRSRFCFQYDVLELNCAAKPYLMRHVLGRPGVSKLVYLDADTYLYRPLSEALEQLERNSILLTPHLVGEAEDDGRKPGERHILESGVYNAGFVGLRKDANAERFLAWWSDRVYDQALRDTRQGLFLDQRWLDLVPGLFAGVHLLRDPGYNLGHWGLTHRRLEMVAGEVRVNGADVTLCHFSGLDLDRPETISRYQDRFTLADVPALAPLLRDYAARVKAAGHDECRRWPYAYARFDNGVPVPRDARRLYWSLGDDAARFGDPFATGGGQSFWNWMREDERSGSRISRLWQHVHSTRPDLQRAFPSPLGPDRVAYLSWIAATGRHEHAMPEALVPAGPPFEGQGSRASSGGDGLPAVRVSSRGPGGGGEEARAILGALAAAGITHCFGEPAAAGGSYPVELLHVSAEDLPRFVRDRGAGFSDRRYTIAFWPGPIAAMPEIFRGSFAYLDEVWVTLGASLETVSRLSPVPVVQVPLDSPQAAGACIRERLVLVARLLSASG